MPLFNPILITHAPRALALGTSHDQSTALKTVWSKFVAKCNDDNNKNVTNVLLRQFFVISFEVICQFLFISKMKFKSHGVLRVKIFISLKNKKADTKYTLR